MLFQEFMILICHWASGKCCGVLLPKRFLLIVYRYQILTPVFSSLQPLFRLALSAPPQRCDAKSHCLTQTSNGTIINGPFRAPKGRVSLLSTLISPCHSFPPTWRNFRCTSHIQLSILHNLLASHSTTFLSPTSDDVRCREYFKRMGMDPSVVLICINILRCYWTSKLSNRLVTTSQAPPSSHNHPALFPQSYSHQVNSEKIQ